MKRTDIGRFLNDDMQIRIWPKRHVDKDLVLEYFATKFEFDKSYHENDVNELLKKWHTFQDWALIRRELFERGYLSRNLEGTNYRRLK